MKRVATRSAGAGAEAHQDLVRDLTDRGGEGERGAGHREAQQRERHCAHDHARSRSPITATDQVQCHPVRADGGVGAHLVLLSLLHLSSARMTRSNGGRTERVTLYLGWSNGVHGCLLSTGSGELSGRPWFAMGLFRLFGGLRVCRREGRRRSGEPDEHRETAELRFHGPVLLLVCAAASAFARPVLPDVARRATTSLGETQGILGEYSGGRRTAAPAQVEPARRVRVSGADGDRGAGRAEVVDLVAFGDHLRVVGARHQEVRPGRRGRGDGLSNVPAPAYATVPLHSVLAAGASEVTVHLTSPMAPRPGRAARSL